MKKVLCSLLLTATFSPVLAQSVTWQSPVPVATSTYNNIFPRISLVTGDRPLVTWGSGTSVFSAVWTGTSFTTPVFINPAGVAPYIQTWTGAESDAKGDTVFVTFGTSPINTGVVYTVRSVDGGLTYGDTVRVSATGPGQARFPAVAVGAGGNPVVQFMHMEPGFVDPEYAVSRSTDGGSSYLTHVNASAIAAGEVCDCCPGNIIAVENTHIALFRNAGSNIRTIYAAASNDGSATFTQNTEIDQSNWTISSCPSSGPSGVIAGDSLIAAWMSASKVYIGTMNINDQQVGFNKILGTGISGIKNFPRVAAKGDTVVVVWQGYVLGHPEIFMSTSVTGAAGIGAHVDTVTKDFAGAQLRPDIEFNNGKLHLTYTDDQADDVKYLVGTMGGPVGIAENKTAERLSILSAYGDGNSINLVVSCPAETGATVQCMNTEGKQTATAVLALHKGKHIYTIPAGNANGLQAIQLVTAGGEKRSIKLVVTK